MKNKKQILLIVFFILVVIFTGIIFFIKNNYKTTQFGNNNIKSAESIKEYILNISSYEADITLEVMSNKNTNKYKIVQKFAYPVFKQEMLEPTNIKGLTTIYDGNNLEIRNSQLGLSEIYENYNNISDNSLCLYDFIEDYKINENSSLTQENDVIIMQTSVNDGSIYNAYKKLYIDKTTLKPIKMEIEEVNKKMQVYILYNEIKINSTNKEEILAFKLKIEEENI